jgi:hypothetical protein
VTYPQGVARVITGCNLAKQTQKHMSLKIKIAARLKAKAAGVNLSQKRIDAIVERASKGLTDESDDAAIDANLDVINDLSPFTEMASYDDHQRAKAKKEEQDKEAKRLADIAAGKKPDEVEVHADTPEWMKAYMKTQKEEADALKAEIASIKGEKVTNTRREQYAKTLEGTSDAYKAEALKDFDRLSFKDDTDYTEWVGAKAESVKVFVQEAANGGLGGDRPAGGLSGDLSKTKLASDTELDAVMEQI